MKLVRYNPYRMSRLPYQGRKIYFDDFWRRDWANELQVNHPSVNIVEENDRYVVELAAPGLEREDFNVKLEKDHLIISSEKKMENEEKGENYTRREFNFSSFKRSFYLPETVNKDEISANYNNGILSVTLLKREEDIEKGPRNIEIN